MRTRVLVLLLAMLLPVVVAVLTGDLWLRSARSAEAHQRALAAAEQAAGELQRLVEGAEGVLRSALSLPFVTTPQADQCTAYLKSARSRLTQYTAIAVVDAQGALVCRSDDVRTAAKLSDRSYFIDAKAQPGEVVVGDFIVSRVSQVPSLPIAIAAPGENGVVVVLGLDLERLGVRLRERSLTPGGSVTVADDAGTIIAREPLPGAFVGTKIPDQFRPLLDAERPGTIEVTSQDGTRRILGYVPLNSEPLGLYVSAGISIAEINGLVDSATRIAMFSGVAVVIILIALLLVYGDRIGYPIKYRD